MPKFLEHSSLFYASNSSALYLLYYNILQSDIVAFLILFCGELEFKSFHCPL